MRVLRIGVVGDYQPGNETHTATAAAVEHAAASRGWAAEVTWIPTRAVMGAGEAEAEDAPEGAAARTLAGFDALWIAPGSPYQSMRGALAAITYARAPTTCRCSAPAAASSTC
ncbi:MAG TPA: hypothetical protein VF995_07365 [Actinomycetota bacterium]